MNGRPEIGVQNRKDGRCARQSKKKRDFTELELTTKIGFATAADRGSETVRKREGREHNKIGSKI